MDERLFYLEKVEKYKRMKTVGVVLSVAGTIAMIAAVAMVNEDDYTGYYTDDDDYSEAVVAVAGVSALGAGIPLWIVGAHNQNKYEQKLKNVSIGMRITPQSRGLTLTYRF